MEPDYESFDFAPDQLFDLELDHCFEILPRLDDAAGSAAEQTDQEQPQQTQIEVIDWQPDITLSAQPRPQRKLTRPSYGVAATAGPRQIDKQRKAQPPIARKPHTRSDTLRALEPCGLSPPATPADSVQVDFAATHAPNRQRQEDLLLLLTVAGPVPLSPQLLAYMRGERPLFTLSMERSIMQSHAAILRPHRRQ